MTLKNLVIYTLPLILAGLCFSVFTHYFYGQIGDDGYIYFRYVERALTGHFGSWSDHVKPAEGFSSVLWYGLLTFFAKLGVSVSLAAKSLGVLFSALSLMGTYILARQLGAGKFAAGMACFILSINAGFHYWSTSGLETPLYIALCLFTAIAMVAKRWVVFMLALIGIARPEGPFLVVAFLVSYQVVTRCQLKRVAWVICLVPMLLWLAFRLHYYELPLPNTFYAKATGDKAVQMIKGLIYALPVIIPLAVSWFVFFFNRKSAVLVALGIVNWLLVFVVSGGGDWMIHFRLLLPVIALLLAIIAAQISSVAGKKTQAILILAGLPLVCLSVYPSDWVKAFQGEILDEKLYQEGSMTRVSKELADEISRHYQKSPLLIAVNHAGALPYWLADDNFIDMVGLNNQTIAMAQGAMHDKYDIEYVFAQSPDLIILNSRVRPGTENSIYHPGYWAGETALYTDPRFLKHYRFSGISYSWQWQIAMPYRLIYPGFPESWILVYEKKSLK